MNTDDAQKINLFNAILLLRHNGEFELAEKLSEKHDYSSVMKDVGHTIIKEYQKSEDSFWLTFASNNKLEKGFFNKGYDVFFKMGWDDYYESNEIKQIQSFVVEMYKHKLWSGDTLFSFSMGEITLRSLAITQRMPLSNEIIKNDVLTNKQLSEKSHSDFVQSMLETMVNNYGFYDLTEKNNFLTLIENQHNQNIDGMRVSEIYDDLFNLGLRTDAPFHVIIGALLLFVEQQNDPIYLYFRDIFLNNAKKDYTATAKHMAISLMHEENPGSLNLEIFEDILDKLNVSDRALILKSIAKNSTDLWEYVVNFPCFQRVFSENDMIDIIQSWEEDHPKNRSSSFWHKENSFRNAMKWGPEGFEKIIKNNIDFVFSSIRKERRLHLPCFIGPDKVKPERDREMILLATVSILKGLSLNNNGDYEVIGVNPIKKKRM